ncbi:MAG: hypothetical protein GY753_08835 [Gammaproteobacteria bacterium]|nr:hypothetical protein [Gammaproteobacteria bacterium]
MPRPLRIEYENAYYHVMNRGRGRQHIFHGDDYFNVFLSTLEQAHQRFGLQILCYCLMSNHYHLLVKTPEANLGRAMRHINGQYTQAYNRLRKTDGSLFRGRYKAILVEQDSYQLQLSRYIHRNPIDAKMVEQLDDYRWSSYPSYVSNKLVPDWLYQLEIYQQPGVKSRQRERYRAFVEMGVDEEIAAFYRKAKQKPYLGSDSFRDWVYRLRQADDPEIDQKALKYFRPDIDQVTDSIARYFKVSRESIMISQRGRVEENIPRWMVMYLAQEICGLKLQEIADFLGLKRVGSIPTTVSKLKQRIANEPGLAGDVDRIKSEYYI